MHEKSGGCRMPLNREYGFNFHRLHQTKKAKAKVKGYKRMKENIKQQMAKDLAQFYELEGLCVHEDEIIYSRLLPCPHRELNECGECMSNNCHFSDYFSKIADLITR